MAIRSGREGVRRDQVDHYGRIKVGTDKTLEDLNKQVDDNTGLKLQVKLGEVTLPNGSVTSTAVLFNEDGNTYADGNKLKEALYDYKTISLKNDIPVDGGYLIGITQIVGCAYSQSEIYCFFEYTMVISAVGHEVAIHEWYIDPDGKIYKD